MTTQNILPPDLERLLSRVSLNSAIPLSGLPDSAVSLFATLLARREPAPIVLVAATTRRAEAMYRELLYFTRHLDLFLPIWQFPAWEILPFEPLSPFAPLVSERLSTLFRLTQMSGQGAILAGDERGHPKGVIVTTPAALMQRVMPRQVLSRYGFVIAVHDQLNVPQLRKFLAISGYHATSLVTEPGEFAVRGGIIDLFPPGREEPVRVELFGDTVETLRLFDPVTQRSTDSIPFLRALPVCEVILDEETIRTFRTEYRNTFGGAAAEDEIYRLVSKGEKYQGMEHYLPLFHAKLDTFFDYLPQNSLFLWTETCQEEAVKHSEDILKRHQSITAQYPEGRFLPVTGLYLSLDDYQNHVQNSVHFFINNNELVENTLFQGFSPTPDYYRQLDSQGQPILQQAAEHLKGLRKQGYRVCLVARTLGQQERLREVLVDYKLPPQEVTSWMQAFMQPPGSFCLTVGDVARGFMQADLRLALISEDAFFGPRVTRRKVHKGFLDQMIASFADLNEGDLVVHIDHGVAQYGGLHSLTIGVIKNDFLLLFYADGDKLYVPVENLDLVSKHAGGEGVSLDKLGGSRWQKTKQKVQQRIFEMAEELVRLQAQRQAKPGFAFSGTDPLYQEFAATFPFEETPDQGFAIEKVLEDMQTPRPMDRLVCGDVGYGKTEVALRAAFRAAMDGKQVAVLAPTTILAQQHYETFARRMAAYPIQVALLSRFRKPSEIKQVIENLALGRIEIVIGTHRLLQKDIVFKDLGLLVVDEEQRFGVAHKECIKGFRASVDILTLTATPIPRTMHMAMAGIRDISIIATPPVDRLSIRTVITQYQPELIREAILREIYRGGQVFYLYNQVRDIDQMAAKLAQLVPEAKVGVAHGQMRGTQLERVMLAFYRQEFNLLLCTTIIENGVDIPSVNTIIIHRADKFGLAQLHQLRGRVGRSKRRAYAYLLIPPRDRLAADALRRLEAFESLGDLGAGFMLATHDLEIRGAGNILGEEQSGQIREVGFDLYNQMLQEAILILKGENEEGEKSAVSEEGAIVPNINLYLSTFIPDTYVSDVHQRLSLYKRISGLGNFKAIAEMRLELIDRFGRLPQTVENLLKVMGFKWLCKKLKIVRLEAGPKGGSIQFHPQPNIDSMALIQLIQKGGGHFRLNQESSTLTVRNRDWAEPETRIKELEQILTSLSPEQMLGKH
ncbi:MAG: transcription-repair coupling factor [Magnetococcus sp. DMHC-6]